MAIVINGSGTVTGLAVGGLPDGTVDADTLAANSVVTGKITDGAILNADINASAAIAGTKINGSFGKVLQVVQDLSTSETVTGSASYVDVSNLSATITPSASSSKILVLVSLNGCLKNASNTTMKANIVRGSTQLQQMTAIGMASDSTAYIGGNTVAGAHLDSPNTTNATTYKCQIASQAGSANVRVNTSDNGGATSSITLMEIGA